MATLIYFNHNTSTIYGPNYLNVTLTTFDDLYQYFLNHACQVQFYDYKYIKQDYPKLPHCDSTLFIVKIENNCIYYVPNGNNIKYYDYFRTMEHISIWKYLSFVKYTDSASRHCLCHGQIYGLCSKCINTYKSKKYSHQLLFIRHFNLVGDVQNLIISHFIYF
jgi:hypothetical protein